MDTQLDILLAQLKDARTASRFYRDEMQTIVENAKQSDNYKVAYDGSHNAELNIDDLETQIRQLALTEYETTKNKNVHPKVAIKVFKTFKIVDPAKVLAWVKVNLADALIYDSKKVESYAKKIGVVDGTDIVEEPKAQIASEL